MKSIFFCLLLLVNGVCFAQSDSLKIIVLGDSRSDGQEGTDGINQQVLSKLFSMVKSENPDAVFFTGDLTLGLEKEDEIADSLETYTAPENDMYENHWAKDSFVYNSDVYKKQLNTFREIVNKDLGGDIPFYPMVGNHEAVGPDAIQIFVKTFGIQDIAPIDSAHLAYYVKIGNALFAIMATDYYDRQKEALVEHSMNEPQMDWLSKILQDTTYKYKFVMGHEPGYSLQGLRGTKPAGLDKDTATRNKFWNILKSNAVNAYICAHEHTYNAQVLDSMWQVITGGAGAPLEKGSFYHYIVLTIPAAGTPRVKVIDINGSLRDNFELK